MIFIATIVLLCYVWFSFYLAGKIVFRQEFYFLLVYIIFFLSTYTVVISMIHSSYLYEPLTYSMQYAKELFIFGTVVFFVLCQRHLLYKNWRFVFLDKLFLLFVLLTFIYLLFPIGPASFISKAVYTKNILLMVVSYFIGRNVTMKYTQWNHVFLLIGYLTLASGLVIFTEKMIGMHFHSLIGFARYHLDIYEQEAAGPYNLTWTFVAQGGQKRFAGLFANPLELSASMLLTISLGYYMYSTSSYRFRRRFYLIVLTVAIMSVLFAYSRASFVAVFFMFLVMAVLLRYFRFLIGVTVIFTGVLFYLVTLAPQDIQYFVLDTISFRETSSITHAIEWFEAIESIQAQPLGMGLATSGNAGGVEADLKVGGENQFLVFGVQLGLMGMLLYFLMYTTAIWSTSRIFLQQKMRSIAIVPFTAAATKAGLFLPLMTANAETYLYVSMVSWWLVGYSIQLDNSTHAAVKES